MKNKKINEYLTINNESLNDEKMQFTGLAVEYGALTRNSSVYYKETFNVSETGVKPALFNHDINNVIGNVEFYEGKTGIDFKISLNPNLKEAQEKWEMIKHGDLTGVSIGSIISEYDIDEDDEGYYTFHAKKGTLEELSLVTTPSAANARIKTYEAFGEDIEEEKEKSTVKVEKEIKNMNLTEIREMIASKTEKKNEAAHKLNELTKVVEEAVDEQTAEAKLEEKQTQEELVNAIQEELDDLEKESLVRESKLAALKEKNKATNKVAHKEKKNMKNHVNKELLTSQEALQEFYKTEKGKTTFQDAIKEAVTNGESAAKILKNKVQAEGFTGNLNALMPKYVDQEIQDKMQQKGKLLNFVNTIVGVTNWTVVFNKSEELGNGHVDGNEKLEQSNELDSIEILSQYIYKYVTVTRSQLDQPSNVLYDYIIDELTTRLALTAERAILIDDGKSGEGHIDKIKPLATRAADEFMSEVSVAALDIAFFDTVEEEINDELIGENIFIMNPKTFTQLKNTLNTVGQRVFEPSEVVLNGFKYDTLDGKIILKSKHIPDMATAKIGDAFAIGLKSKAYSLIMQEASADLMKNFILKGNKHEFLIEQRMGGDLTKLASAVKVKKAAAPKA